MAAFPPDAHTGLPRWIAAIVAVVVTLASIIVIVGVVALIILEQGIAFIENLPAILDAIEMWYHSLALPDSLRAGIDSILVSVGDNLSGLDQGSVVVGIVRGGRWPRR